MKSGRQALQLCFDATVVVVIQICNQFLFEVFHGLKLLQIQQLTLEQPKEVLNHSVVQTVSLAALLPVFLYNGEKGRSPKSPAAAKAAQLGFYLFYPVHLLLLWALW